MSLFLTPRIEYLFLVCDNSKGGRAIYLDMLHSIKEKIRVGMSKSEYVVMVDEATNDDPWGPTGAQMDELTRVFHSGSADIMEELELRIKNRSASWRRCYKSLLVLDHLARNVHENCLPDICRLIPLFRNVATTFHCNQGGQDHGLSVRERSRKLADLLSDPIVLRDERAKSDAVRKKVQGIEGSGKPDVPPEVRRIESFQPQPKPNSTGTYDPYVPAASRAESRHSRDTLREEQEKADLALAMKLQAEENKRAAAGPQAPAPAAQQRVVAAKPVPPPGSLSGLSQEDLDMRLAMELQRRLDAGEEVSPTLFQQYTASRPTTDPTRNQQQQAPVQPQQKSASPAQKPSDDFASFFAPTQAPPSKPPAQPIPFDPFAPTPVSTNTSSSTSQPPSDAFFNQYLNERTAQAGPSASQGRPLGGLDLFATPPPVQGTNSTYAPSSTFGQSASSSAGAHQQLDLFSSPVAAPVPTRAPQAAAPQPQDIFSFTPGQQGGAPPAASSGQMLQQLGLFSGSASANTNQPTKTLGEIVAEKKGAW